MFHKKSLVTVSKEGVTEDELMEAALGAGAEDLRDDGESWSIVSPPDAHESVLAAIESKGLKSDSSEVTMVPENSVKVEGKQAAAVMRMIEVLEEQDDVQNVYSNFDIEDKELEALSA
jgi:transcriptional/translational regulatory protein YebC/TACO1